jgi:hypothetical protein
MPDDPAARTRRKQGKIHFTGRRHRQLTQMSKLKNWRGLCIIAAWCDQNATSPVMIHLKFLRTPVASLASK